MWDLIGVLKQSDGAHIQGFFLDILKKTQARKNSKLKRILMKTQAKFLKNSKNANSTWALTLWKLHFHSKNVPQAEVFSKIYTLQALCHSKTPYFQDSFEIKQMFEKNQLNCKKTQAKSQKNSKTANSSWVDLSKKVSKKALIVYQNRLTWWYLMIMYVMAWLVKEDVKIGSWRNPFR